jgi:hypothetical protein
MVLYLQAVIRLAMKRRNISEQADECMSSCVCSARVGHIDRHVIRVGCSGDMLDAIRRLKLNASIA